MSAARQVLDRAHSLAAIAELESDPGRYARELATELPEDLEARDAFLAGALGHVDATIARVMSIRLEHALAAEPSIAAPTRKVFAATITGYARDLSLLSQRARDVAVRGRAPDPDRVAAIVVDAARATLALRDALRADLLALIRELATAAIADADRKARDRQLDESERKRWSAVRRDLEALAGDPERITTGPLAARLAALPEQLDEPAAAPEPSLADLIELD